VGFFSAFFDDSRIEWANFSAQPFFAFDFPGVVFVPDALVNGVKVEAAEEFELIVVAQYHLSVEGADHDEILYVLLLYAHLRFFPLQLTQRPRGNAADV